METEITVQVRLQNGQHLRHANRHRITAICSGRRYRLHYATKADGRRTDCAGYYFWEDAPDGTGMCGTHATIRELVVNAITQCRARIVIADPAA